MGLLYVLMRARGVLRFWAALRVTRLRANGILPALVGGFLLALPTAIAAAWLAVALLPAPTAERMAVFADQNAETLWVISADLDQGLLQTEAVNAPASASNTSYELWVLPAEGPPLSLGLLPVIAGSVETQISAQLVAALAGAGRLAISVEPVGGSPTGLPTGPVVYQASLVTI